MPRVGMNVQEFNDFMKKCKKLGLLKVRYVSPTIHIGSKHVVAMKIVSTYETKEFTITNNPDEDFNLNKAVNEYVDSL
ncbi:hypothetical protein SP15_190 [Bacillus phage SP-15]|uniref:Uncharacterized protein n=1 Tax=Bacillus phage SP-15 TaxID=1792032 RepID=A0A127AWK8_9CAUD|nr:hypothetical protein SP15_190 [Bacillus phage SP-15]AMM44990.1 hypothetical protein SP15_190 [Bacillus phage SP-15]